MAKRTNKQMVKRLYFTATASDKELVKKVQKREEVSTMAKATSMVFAKGKNYYKKILKD